MGSKRVVTLLLIALLVGLVGAFMAASWAIVDTVIHATSDDEFCSSCHSHYPIGSSYREDIHGGNNPVGWQATCSNCHIPTDNALHYLWVKGVHGVVDPLMELIKKPHEIDWHGNRQRRAEYVYDSGCLGCHTDLQSATESNFQAFLPHRKYFSSDDLRCVECHEHVGHSRLGHHLEIMGWQQSTGEQP